jgi:GntR family transcriptional regulator
MTQWRDDKPIYVQLRDTVVHSIVTGALAEGDAVPSVRQVAAAEKINPITVSKAYQMLVDEDLLETRRGLGMYVREGAQAAATEQERARFLGEEWPRIRARIDALGLSISSLLESDK